MQSKTTLIIASTAAVLTLALSVYVLPMQSAKALITARTLVFPLQLKNLIKGQKYAIHILVHDRVRQLADVRYVVGLTAPSSIVNLKVVETAPLVFIPGNGVVAAGLTSDTDTDSDCDCFFANIFVASTNIITLTYTYSTAVLPIN
jgi:hypothetical protein